MFFACGHSIDQLNRAGQSDCPHRRRARSTGENKNKKTGESVRRSLYSRLFAPPVRIEMTSPQLQTAPTVHYRGAPLFFLFFLLKCLFSNSPVGMLMFNHGALPAISFEHERYRLWVRRPSPPSVTRSLFVLMKICYVSIFCFFFVFRAITWKIHRPMKAWWALPSAFISIFLAKDNERPASHHRDRRRHHHHRYYLFLFRYLLLRVVLFRFFFCGFWSVAVWFHPSGGLSQKPQKIK